MSCRQVAEMNSKKAKCIVWSLKAVSWESKKVRLKKIKAFPVLGKKSRSMLAFKLKPKCLKISSDSGKLMHPGPRKLVTSEQQAGTRGNGHYVPADC